MKQITIFEILDRQKPIDIEQHKGIRQNYHIEEIPYQTAMEIVIKNHYLHRKCPCSKAYGLIDNRTNEIKGVVTYGVSCSSTLLKGICGEEEMHNVYELNRLWVSDDVEKNGESFLIANTLKLLDKEIIVSFADSSQGHIGYVYQATNGEENVYYVDRPRKHRYIYFHATKKRKRELLKKLRYKVLDYPKFNF